MTIRDKLEGEVKISRKSLTLLLDELNSKNVSRTEDEIEDLKSRIEQARSELGKTSQELANYDKVN